ncbi:MAG: ADYC domain-containing protein [Nannocystaceae bacterium]
MRMGSNIRAALLLASVFAVPVGCAADTEIDATIELRPGSGGVWLNTSVLGVLPLSELDLSGKFHRDVRVDQILIQEGDDAVVVDHTWSESGELRGLVGDQEVGGAAFLHSRWELTLQSDGGLEPATLFLSEVLQGDKGWRYVFTYDVGGGSFTALCDEDLEESGHAAVVIGDLTVDPITADMEPRADTLYLACTSGAVGKAALWGYAPWTIGLDAFEAAVRMVRADYCGDGTSWTKPGTPIQIADVWGIHGFTDKIGQTEAFWGEGGAICLSHPRAGGKVTCPGGDLPTCEAGAILSSEPGALLWTRLAPWSANRGH